AFAENNRVAVGGDGDCGRQPRGGAGLGEAEDRVEDVGALIDPVLYCVPGDPVADYPVVIPRFSVEELHRNRGRELRGGERFRERDSVDAVSTRALTKGYLVAASDQIALVGAQRQRAPAAGRGKRERDLAACYRRDREYQVRRGRARRRTEEEELGGLSLFSLR